MKAKSTPNAVGLRQLTYKQYICNNSCRMTVQVEVELWDVDVSTGTALELLHQSRLNHGIFM